jgi:hypothetical protein
LQRLAFEAAVHALGHFGILLTDKQERKDADNDDLEEDESGHELAANRSWSEDRHSEELPVFRHEGSEVVQEVLCHFKPQR